MRRLFIALLVLIGCATAERPAERPAQNPDPGRYYPIQLHLHGSQSEGSASMAAHDAVAAEIGTVDVLWWTDHDWRIARHGTLDQFNFEEREEHFDVPHRGVPWSRRPDTAWVSWREEVDPGIVRHWARLEEKGSPAGGRSLELGAIADFQARDWQSFGAVMTSTAGRLKISLAADVTLKLRVRPLTAPDPDAQMLVTAILSQHPGGPTALAYSIGESGEPRSETRGNLRLVVIPTPAPFGEWTDLELPLTRDAVRFDLGGFDNSLRLLHLGVRVRRGAVAGGDVDALRIEHGADGAVVLQRAEEIARGLEERSGIVHHVGLELSYSAHMNAYLPKIELPDFAAHPHGMTPEQMVEWTHERGGVVSYNHVFGTIPSHHGQYEERARWLLENRGFGADLLEVGYPHRVLPLQRHLDVWDKLSRRGVVIGGVGTGDSHNPGDGWREGNNYVTWVYARNSSREELLRGLRSRRAFFGDPMLFRGTLELRTEDGIPMGRVVPVDDAPEQRVEMLITGLPEGSEVRWIVHGRRAQTLHPPAGDLRRVFPIDGRRARFVRAEVWLGERGIAFSNCLYFVSSSRRVPSRG